MTRRIFPLLVIPAVLVLVSCIQRPEKRDDLVYHNTYKTVKTLIITSDVRKTEGWIEVQKKDVERKFGLKDTVYMVFCKDVMVGFVTADHKAFKLKFRNPPYELPEKDPDPVTQYVGTWRTLETAVQNILDLHYPVKIF